MMSHPTAAAIAAPSPKCCKQYVRVTVSHGEEHGLLDIEENECVNSLHQKILVRFPELKSEDFVVKYKDDEGDWITVGTTSDLREALEFLRETNEDVPNSAARYRESRVSQGTLQLIIKVVEKKFQSSMTVASTALSVATDDSSEECDLNQVISAYKKGAIERDSVEGILTNTVREIPPAVYNHCPIARLFKYMVRSLVQSTRAERPRAVDGYWKLEDGGGEPTPSPRSLLEPAPSHRSPRQDGGDGDRKDEVGGDADVGADADVRPCERMDLAAAAEMLRGMGFQDERKIRAALDAEGGNVENALDRLLTEGPRCS
mmetsp:Transcript_11713/g.23581  ORF Transcript_11713/g.23581 Transcript_11713/m.23581 type:complete len:317 (-) Transcript_11713:472-1422(-)